MPEQLGSEASRRAVLRTHSLCKSFRGSQAVKNVNLSVAEGSVHALIGPNGAGKTTCFNLLTRFLPSDSGEIYYRDEPITRHTAVQVAKKGVVRSFQISAVFTNLSVRDNLALALQRRQGFAPFWRSMQVWKRNDKAIEQLAKRAGLTKYLSVSASTLSYGRKRALELATTIALEPDILLLDEPTAGMGHEDIEIMSQLIRQSAEGRTVVMVEHNLSVVESLCDRVTVLQRGEVIAEGSYGEVSRNALVRSAYMGLEDV
jgi:branched-chain amino acid transport system ATP-binding protein